MGGRQGEQAGGAAEFLRQQANARSEANLKYLNEALQKTSLADVRQAMFDLIAQEQKKAMIANTQKEYAFQMLDDASSPDKKPKPHRAIIVVLATFEAGFLVMAFVLMLDRLGNDGEPWEVTNAEERGHNKSE